MTPDDLARLKALAEAATPGKRMAMVRTGRNPPHLSHEWQIIAATAPGHGIYSDHPGGCSPAADMELIAACDPDTVKALIEAATPVPAGASSTVLVGCECSLCVSNRLLAERDAARAEAERLREAVWNEAVNEMASEANLSLMHTGCPKHQAEWVVRNIRNHLRGEARAALAASP